MYWITLVLVSLVPGVLWVWFFYRQDRYDKEPKQLIMYTFIAGMAAVIPAALIEMPFRHYLTTDSSLIVQLITAVVVVGLVEEGVKLLAASLVTMRHPAFNEPVDGIIYVVTASLGFAAVENLVYALTFGLAVLPVRSVVTSLAHASFGGISGLYLGMARCGVGEGRIFVLRGLAIAAVLHGVYDFLILGEVVHPIVSIAIVYGTYRFVSRKIQRLTTV